MFPSKMEIILKNLNGLGIRYKFKKIDTLKNSRESIIHTKLFQTKIIYDDGLSYNFHVMFHVQNSNFVENIA